MAIVEHKFKNHKISPDTEILIIGTFNPDSEKNPADFFYGRARNNLWKLLPLSFNKETLKNETREQKINFCNSFKISFIDLIKKR